MDKYTSTLSPNNLGANVISLLQGTVCDILNADTQLSKVVSFLPENIKDIDSQVKTALGKQGMVATVMTPDVSYQGRREDHAYYDFTDAEIDIVENPVVNRASNRKAEDFASAQDTALRAIYVLENSDLGDFNVKGVTSGEYDGLLVTKVTFDAFCKLQPEGPEPEPEWKSGITLERTKNISTRIEPPVLFLLNDPPADGRRCFTMSVETTDGEILTKDYNLAGMKAGESIGSDAFLADLGLSAPQQVVRLWIHNIDVANTLDFQLRESKLAGKLSKSITERLAHSHETNKFRRLFGAYDFRLTRTLVLGDLVLDCPVITDGCYYQMFYKMRLALGYGDADGSVRFVVDEVLGTGASLVFDGLFASSASMASSHPMTFYIDFLHVSALTTVSPFNKTLRCTDFGATSMTNYVKDVYVTFPAGFTDILSDEGTSGGSRTGLRYAALAYFGSREVAYDITRTSTNFHFPAEFEEKFKAPYCYPAAMRGNISPVGTTTFEL